jgi:phosphatidylserine/phosphatidylglycerophosphate/cardiolipin synthase-like enzyme
MLNFKANHRKLVICDAGREYAALITSANPHDGSAAHGNTAIYIKGPAALDLLQSEKAVPGFPEGCNLPSDSDAELPKSAQSEITAQVVSEGRIKDVLLSAINLAGKGDSLDMIVFYLSDRDIVSALKRAFLRDARVRILLDPNKDAFGRAKNGIPNRQVAAELVKAGIPVRWSNTHGEQSHTKMLMVEYKDGQSMFALGSANFTRRNLEDLNLETDIAVHGPRANPIFLEARNYTDLLWNNPDGRKFSVDYIEYADNSFFRRLMYRWMEATGMSTF